ncbi:MAG: dTDP-4-dehydrorhamnose 3,5-epimerase family protein [Deltaproteobacteria bacterium]|nr:dTDP-4-dehydrorhamnose 3,5-epimerase family protein [Deltaproteobacteria bacterium]
MKTIEGVVTKKLRVIPDDRGRLMEILRADDPFFRKFGQAYVSTTYPGVVKAWHLHRLQEDHLCCIVGTVKLVVFDAREESATYRELNEFWLGEHNPVLVVVPRLCYHGWKNVGLKESIVVDIPSEPYNYEHPDEHRLDPHDNKVIPYSWERRDA